MVNNNFRYTMTMYVNVITQTVVTLSCRLIYMIQVISELEEAELREEKEKLAAENKNGEENKYALDIIRPGIHILD